MPRRDGTGPMGRGSMAGRCMGFCVEEFASGVSMGLACRRGFRRWFGGGNYSGNISVATEKELLNEEKTVLQKRLENIDKRIENL